VIAVVAVASWLTGRGGNGQETGSAPFVGGDLHSFVVSSENPNLLFTGGHGAVSASTDGGRTWSSVDTLQDADAMGWAFLDGAIWIGGHPGLEVSTNDGRSFEPRNDGLPATDIHALGGSGGTLYAASPGAGFLASTDGGASWEVRNAGVGQGFMGAILVDPSDVERIVAPDMSAGAAESLDGGRTWRALGGVSGAMWVSWDPTNPDHLIVTGPGTAAASLDSGKTWAPVALPAGASLVQIDPNDPRISYAAALSEDGTVSVSVSSDGGSTWTPL
jgi:photosystem II stability/assembly factor-like uncharacterized protein